MADRYMPAFSATPFISSVIATRFSQWLPIVPPPPPSSISMPGSAPSRQL